MVYFNVLSISKRVQNDRSIRDVNPYPLEMKTLL